MPSRPHLVSLGSAFGTFLILAALGANEAHAQYSVPSQASQDDAEMDESRGPRDRTQRETLQIAGNAKLATPKPDKTPWELGASLNFVTSEPSLGGEKLESTDLVLLRIHALVTLAGFNIFAGTDILPKQPSYTDELVWQGSMLGARKSISKNFAAYLRAQGGPHLSRTGYWLSGEGAAQYAYQLVEELSFEAALGVAHTQLHFKENTETFHFQEEVFTRMGLAIRDKRRGLYAAWLNFDYYYPLFARPTKDNPDGRLLTALAPQPRVNVRMGGLIPISDHARLFAEFTILDRGDLEDPTTTLPILNGGFDQNQLVIGFIRHFGRDAKW